ncbi:MAG: S1 RNA-binding domain-containing protein [Ruminococcaceae bacterium]|jgi:S1 RNA binding domain protein|nr:S1 RNA-binding domain-containing protein [Oscillospiraceae bacterium]
MVEVGQILVGKVTGLTDFGAFVTLESGETGMVHISEVANTFVKNISEHLSEGDEVTVKVLEINEKGKISLSIKQAQEPKKVEKPKKTRPQPKGWQGLPEKSTENQSFEDMLASFKKTSEDRMSDLKRSTESKRGSRRGYGK